MVTHTKTQKDEMKGVMCMILFFLTILFILKLVISIISFPWKWHQNDNRFTSGIILQDNLIKSKYELMGSGLSVECFGAYSNYKLKNNESVNLERTITVCGKH